MQDVTVTLDNKEDNKHVVFCVSFLKCVVTEFSPDSDSEKSLKIGQYLMKS